MRLLTTILFFLTVSFQSEPENCFMATLKPGEKKTEVIINGVAIFTIAPGQLFFYDNIVHHAFRADGKMGGIEPERVIKVAKVDLFKFKYADDFFNYKNEENELIGLGHRHGVDFNGLIKKIRNKDSKAFKDYLGYKNKTDGAATEIYYETFWELINDWTDKELSDLTKSLDLKAKKEFKELMIPEGTYWPLEKYYKKYYPTTFSQINKDM